MCEICGLPHAEFSPDGRFRYVLRRCWGDGPLMHVCSLNPSMADHEKNDPTVRRDIGFGQRLGYGRLEKTNAGAYRSTNPARLLRTPDPIGPDNDAAILLAASKADVNVIAW